MTCASAALLCALALAEPARSGPLFPALRDGKWGYIDRDGTVSVEPRFDEAGRFSEGLAPVRLGTQLGFIDTTGTIVLAPPPGLEPTGGTVHRGFAGGRARVKKAGRYGFIDRAGRLAVPPRWLSAEDFSEGRAFVCDEWSCGFTDPDGRYRDVSEAMGGTSFRNGFASITLAMGMSHRRTAFVNAAGARVPGEYEGNGSFSEGLAPVRLGGAWRYVDTTGTLVLRSAYAGAGEFSEHLAAVTDGDTGRCGYIDRSGKLVIPARFASCRPFSGGLARVDLAEHESDGEDVAFIGRDGTIRIRGAASNPPFRFAGDFADGLAAVADGPLDLAGDGQVKLGYIDERGRFVWPMQR